MCVGERERGVPGKSGVLYVVVVAMMFRELRYVPESSCGGMAE